MAATLPVAGGEEIAVFHTMRDEFYALVNKCPHKQGPLSQGIVHGDSVDLPAAQLEHLAAQRRGAGRRRGLRADDPGQGRRRAHLPAARGGRAQAGRRRRRRERDDPHHLRLLRRRLRHRGDGRPASARSTIAGDPEHPANRGKLCSKGTHLGETVGLEGRLLHPEIGGRRASWDKAIRPRRAASSPTRSRATGPTASPSTSRASC